MNKILLSTLAGAVALITLSPAAHASDSSSGCGLGWQVTQRTSLLSSAVRSTTNAFLPNTFSMTSGTSGCAKHEIVKNDAEAVQYAVSNYDTLIVEMAQGEGEFLQGFAQALGCDAASYAAFDSFAQAQYGALVQESGTDGIALYRAVRTRLLSTPGLGDRCAPRATRA